MELSRPSSDDQVNEAIGVLVLLAVGLLLLIAFALSPVGTILFSAIGLTALGALSTTDDETVALRRASIALAALGVVLLFFR